ncbi:MAG TPA: pantetheine-phosphate adenylyltransferase [Firmicutes bacterium]|nr:pantetheine-phosphate adenylyltransferase [Bacillota bacterium]
MRTAVYPGSFDPVTLGHLDIITRAAKIFDTLYVAVLINPTKRNTWFSAEERVAMLHEATAHLPNVICESFSGLSVDYAHKREATVLVRGLRAVSDFEYELKLSEANRHLSSEVETVFLMTNHAYSFISSGIVREVAEFGGSVIGWVPECVLPRLAERIKKQEGRGK